MLFAETYFSGKQINGAIIEDIRKKLGKIRDFLEQNYSEIPICLVSETYYVRYRDNPPETEAEARRCLPVGHAIKQEGLRLKSGDGDLIWQQAMALNLASGAGKVKKSGDRVLRAVQAERLAPAAAQRLLSEPAERYPLDSPELAAQLLQELPPGEEDGEHEGDAS